MRQAETSDIAAMVDRALSAKCNFYHSLDKNAEKDLILVLRL